MDEVFWPTGVECIDTATNTFIDWDRFRYEWEAALAAIPPMSPDAAANLQEFLATRNPYPQEIH